MKIHFKKRKLAEAKQIIDKLQKTKSVKAEKYIFFGGWQQQQLIHTQHSVMHIQELGNFNTLLSWFIFIMFSIVYALDQK